MGKLTINGHFQLLFVCLPEGTWSHFSEVLVEWPFWRSQILGIHIARVQMFMAKTVVKGGERWWKVVKGGERWWKVVKGGNMAGCQILELLCDMRRVHQPYVDWKKKTLAPWFSKTHPFSPANHASRALLHQPRSDHCWLMIQRCAEPQKCANCGGITLHPWKTGCSFQGFPKWISS